jgi:hypothetical protein
MTASAASTTIPAIHKIRVGFMVVSLSLQPAHGGIGSEAPDHEVIDGTRNWSEDCPKNAQQNDPASTCRLLRIGWLPFVIRIWLVHECSPPFFTQLNPSRLNPLTLKYKKRREEIDKEGRRHVSPSSGLINEVLTNLSAWVDRQSRGLSAILGWRSI